jgi:hypothetical protein
MTNQAQTPRPHKPAPLRLALSRDEAAAAIGVSRDHFDRHVLPNIKTAAIGRRVVVSVREIESYLDRRAL